MGCLSVMVVQVPSLDIQILSVAVGQLMLISKESSRRVVVASPEEDTSA